MVGLVSQPIVIQKIMDEGFTVATMISVVIFQLFTFVTPFLLHFVTKKYVREILFNAESDEYTAVTYSFWATDILVSDNLVLVTDYSC